jgi:hypothetical protein
MFEATLMLQALLLITLSLQPPADLPPGVRCYNLIRLGIFIERTEADSEYFPAGTYKQTISDGHVNATTINYVLLTAYGSLFLDICVRDR